MRKFFIMGLVLFIFEIVNSNLSASETIFKLSKTQLNDDLVQKLSENKSFEALIFKAIEFEYKIYKSHSSSLLRKISEKRATEQEAFQFAKNLGYSSFEEVKKLLLELSNLSNEYKKAVPEINDVKDKKTLLEKAVKTVITKPEIKKQFKAVFLPVEEEECWVAFGAMLTICWNLFASVGDYENFLYCIGLADSFLLACLP